MKFRTKYEHRHVGLSFEGVESLTDQQFKDECSIEGIVRRYGILPTPTVTPVGADVSEIGDFQQCMERVQSGLEHFKSLPSEIRMRFGNDPKAFYAWIQNGENIEEACRIGLMERRVEKPTVIEKLDEIRDSLTNMVTPEGGKTA